MFNRAHTKLYVVSELSNELFIFNVNKNQFKLEQTLSVLPEASHLASADGVSKKERESVKKAEPAAAAIRLTSDEKFLYISIRGSISWLLSMYRVKKPLSFSIAPAEEFIPAILS